MVKLAIVRIRGDVNLTGEIRATFQMINLLRRNACIVLEDTPCNLGMIKKVKDFVTWGILNEKGEEVLKNRNEGKKFYRLNSPKKGYGRKGIKVSFNKSGALGYRAEKINDLIVRMA